MANQVAHVTAEGIKESRNSRKGGNKKRPMKPVEQYRKEIEKEIMDSVIKPISFEVFKKTKAEREMLKSMKSLNKELILRSGKDPKRSINP